MELSTILDKTDEKFRTSSSPNRGWENGASWLSRRFILDFRGRGFTPLFYSVLDCSCVYSMKTGSSCCVRLLF